jgi:hypothetical protein
MMRQGGQGVGGWGSGTAYTRMYSPQTIETITGEVLSVDTITPLSGMSSGLHLMVKTSGKQTISVHLGPAWYIESQAGIKFAAGDNVEVRGSRITFQGAPTIIAETVKKHNHVLTLRDPNGVPLWSGSRRR